MRNQKSNKGNLSCTIDIPYDCSEPYGGLFSASIIAGYINTIQVLIYFNVCTSWWMDQIDVI